MAWEGKSWESWDWKEGDAKAAEDPWKAKTDASWSASGSWGDSAAAAAPAAAPSAWDSADASTAADSGSWGQAAGASSWGNAGNAAAGGPSGKDFWAYQEWNKANGVLSRKEEWECEQDDNALFVERLGSNAGIAFDKYENVPVDLSGEKSQMIPVCKSFEELYSTFSSCIPEALKDNVRRCCYKTPTPVQKYAIPAGLAGRDIMCCAQTGSGKTAAFLMPVIGRMMMHHVKPVGKLQVPFEGPCMPDSLVITPTRELCMQIHEEALKFCHRTPYRAVRIFGGEKPKEQMELIAKGADVLVATPGRLQDFIDREITKVEKVQVLVLDEADRMLDMGFEPAVRAIVQNHGMPSKENRQTMMFSATFAENCQKMAQDFLYNYIWIGVGIVGGAVDTVDQRLEKVAPSQKYSKLVETLDAFFAERKSTEHRALVFVNAKDTAKWLDEQLYDKNFDTGALHGNLDQWERTRNLTRFRKGEIDVMIATDVAARGLDIENVVMVINYDMPQDIDCYIHRIGRTGRIGNSGTAVTFISVDESSGSSLENADNLRKLLGVLNDSSSSVPDWLEGTIQGSWGGNGGSMSWGGKDMRSGQESYKGNGAGEEWSSWKNSKSGDAWGGDDKSKDAWSDDKSKDAWSESKEKPKESWGGSWQ